MKEFVFHYEWSLHNIVSYEIVYARDLQEAKEKFSEAKKGLKIYITKIEGDYSSNNIYME
jgi:hypothetical protein